MIHLINVNTLKLETFEKNPPKYAILSHRWDKDEVVYNDIIFNHEASTHKPGWKKLIRFCELTLALGFTHTWLDTCCIDKTSTAELSRSIRSMYMWYAQSDMCIAYLGDITHDQDSFQNSVWFTRGWTLQELIAPRRVEFYDSQWTFFGSKEDLITPISETTGIPPAVLNGELDIQQCSVAQRMSWAAGRDTTEPEDRAYSLVGLFNISCVVQYGEGAENAFLNLQKEIIKEFSDESILAWRWPVNETQDLIDAGCHGMLASSPDWFGSCGNYLTLAHSGQVTYTNGILSLKLLTRPYSLETYSAFLMVTNGMPEKRVGILLARLSAEGEYVRVRDPQSNTSQTTEMTGDFDKVREIAVRQRVTETPTKFFPGFWLRQIEPPGHQRCSPIISSKANCASNDRIKMSPETYGTAGVVRMFYGYQNAEFLGWPRVCWFKFGFDDAFNPVCLVANPLVRPNNYVALSHDLFNESLEHSDDAGRRESLRIFQEHWLPADGQVIRKVETWRQGFVILKGDRKQGLHAVIEGIGLVVAITKCEDIQPSSEVNDHPPQPGSVWTVDIQSTATTERITAPVMAWTCACLCDMLCCFWVDKNMSLFTVLEENEARGPQVTYHVGHQAWR